MMTENKDSATKNRPKFGSGCLQPFIFFFGLCFACGVKDGNVVGAVFFFMVTAFFLNKFLRPKPKKARSRHFPYKYVASGGDRHGEGFDDGIVSGKHIITEVSAIFPFSAMGGFRFYIHPFYSQT